MSLGKKQIQVVALGLPTSWMMTSTDATTARMFSALNGTTLEISIARKDYTTRRERAAQGGQKAKAAGKYHGRVEDATPDTLIQKHLNAGLSSSNEIMELLGCRRGIIAKQAALLKAAA